MPTTVVKTIGTGGDYTTLQAWEDASPVDLVAVDQIWEGRVLNNLSSGSTSLTVTGSTTDATRYKHLTAAPGVSFMDHADKLTNPLRVDNTKGVEIRSTAAWSTGFALSEANFHISRLLVSGTGSTLFSSSNTVVIDNCIFESTTVTAMCNVGGIATNSVFITRKSGSGEIINGDTTTQLINCTLVCPSDFGTKPTRAVKATYGHGNFKNLAVFGCTAISDGAGTNTNCFTDIASPPSGFTTTTYAATFENTLNATRDYRLKAGSSLIDAGTSTGAPTTDIIGTARSGSFDVGAWEVSSGGGGDNIAANLGTATASGFVAGIAAAVTIACSLGSGTANGYQASIGTGSNVTINAALGTATASGYTASVMSSGSATITTDVFKNNTGTVLASTSIPKLAALKLSDMTLAAGWTSQTTNGSGVLSLTDAGMVAATDYLLVVSSADGSAVGVKKYTAT